MTTTPTASKGPTERFFDLLGDVTNAGINILMREQDRKDYKAGLKGDRQLQAGAGFQIDQVKGILIGGGIALLAIVLLAFIMKR
jgi:hypothetical protein